MLQFFLRRPISFVNVLSTGTMLQFFLRRLISFVDVLSTGTMLQFFLAWRSLSHCRRQNVQQLLYVRLALTLRRRAAVSDVRTT